MSPIPVFLPTDSRRAVQGVFFPWAPSLCCLLIWLGSLAFGLTQVRAAAEGAPSKPNIVLIMVDDMGFSDLGCYGSEIQTPNLDALASKGLRFTQFYNVGRCCPTRASLLSGLYPHQAGIGHMTEDRGEEGYRGDLNQRCVTIPEVLKTAGYSTYMVGKWHVTKNVKQTAPEKQTNWPRQRGFDRYFGVLAGTANYYHPNSLAEDNSPLPTPQDNFYTTDAFVDRAIQFIAEGPQDKPFFLYTAFNAPHFPIQAPAEEIAKYRGKYKAGWDKLRLERHSKQIQLGIVDKKWPLSPRPQNIKVWDSLTPEEQDRFDQIMAVYAACVDRMDQAVGRLVEALRNNGQLDNTLIFFLSDNGGNAETGPNGRLEGPGIPGSGESGIHCGESWAHLENTPFRRYKHFNHEGGISTPLVVHWPRGVSAKGELRSQAGHLIDIMATCVAVSGANYPSEYKGQAIQPMEGKSLLPAFANQPIQRDALFWEHEQNAAIRVGDWKLVRTHNNPWELYELKADRTELNDLAAQEPARVKELSERWETWADRVLVEPYPSMNRKGAKAQNRAEKSGKSGKAGKAGKAAKTEEQSG